MIIICIICSHGRLIAIHWWLCLSISPSLRASFPPSQVMHEGGVSLRSSFSPSAVSSTSSGRSFSCPTPTFPTHSPRASPMGENYIQLPPTPPTHSLRASPTGQNYNSHTYDSINLTRPYDTSFHSMYGGCSCHLRELQLAWGFSRPWSVSLADYLGRKKSCTCS